MTVCRLKSVIVVWLVVFVVSLGGGALGDASSTGEDLLPIPHPRTILLRAPGVRKELRLDDTQQAALQATLDEIDPALWRLRDLPAEKRNEPATRLLAQLNGRIGTILSEPQRARLDQLTLQARGIQVLLEPAVSDELKLSAVQVQQMRDVMTTLAQQVAALQQGGVTAREMAQAHILQNQAERNAVALLEREQQRRFRTLTGRPFDLARMRQRACRAPELRGVDAWVNGGPVALEALRGNVVVLHFYTFGCINCIRNLPHYVAWQKHFAGKPVRLVGIHRPETQGERVIAKVREKAAETGLTHPIAIDNDSANWDAWGNHIWPAVYLIDKQGFVRHWWYGELNWQGAQGERHMRGKIEQLLREDG